MKYTLNFSIPFLLNKNYAGRKLKILHIKNVLHFSQILIFQDNEKLDFAMLDMELNVNPCLLV